MRFAIATIASFAAGAFAQSHGPILEIPVDIYDFWGGAGGWITFTYGSDAGTYYCKWTGAALPTPPTPCGPYNFSISEGENHPYALNITYVPSVISWYGKADIETDNCAAGTCRAVNDTRITMRRTCEDTNDCPY
ncbi:hypothetical protein ColLi_00401 [Colletotrichum liriopes]|uniref:Uncharacterized protein n=1 Tax=Colletotrichum liriopes TaxID=708192 RepID=A0AA37LMI8_9PEZI|nr:hypothetical protein ColLi_00401 [Colletotrichum liriopes]